MFACTLLTLSSPCLKNRLCPIFRPPLPVVISRTRRQRYMLFFNPPNDLKKNISTLLHNLMQLAVFPKIKRQKNVFYKRKFICLTFYFSIFCLRRRTKTPLFSSYILETGKHLLRSNTSFKPLVNSTFIPNRHNSVVNLPNP